MKILKAGKTLINPEHITHISFETATAGGTSSDPGKVFTRATILHFVGGGSVKFPGDTIAQSFEAWYNSNGYPIQEIEA